MAKAYAWIVGIIFTVLGTFGVVGTSLYPSSLSGWIELICGVAFILIALFVAGKLIGLIMKVFGAILFVVGLSGLWTGHYTDMILGAIIFGIGWLL